MATDWVVAIPSYDRPDVLHDRTLPLLLQAGIDPSRVWVFVGSNLGPYLDRRPSAFLTYVSAPVGIVRARNHISRYFPEGTPIVEIDDDIRSVDIRPGPDPVLEPVDQLGWLFDWAFGQAADLGASLWGVNPTGNVMMMNGDRVQSGLKFAIGAFHGHVNVPSLALGLPASGKEDYERTLLHYLASGAVARLQHVTIQQSYRGTPGGLADQRNVRSEARAAKYLLDTYPDLVELDRRRSTAERIEVRLRDRRAA